MIGVLGAGTMGAGIAQLAVRSGARTLLHDPVPEALARGVERITDGLQKEAAKGRLSEEQASAAAGRLEAAGELAQLAPCELVIEAAPERLELKHDMYRRLSEIVGEECVLASNTSSLLITAIAPAASPQRVVGMHFFNPAPVMRLLEVVAGEQSSGRALALAEATGEAMGKTVIRASDGPGFLVNRCNRPFGLEALRLLQERISDVETIDRICRMEGGFRMGPFELMDLVGVDVGFEISKSFFEQSFGEPRWRPSPIAARYVAAGLHGRKTGRGYYSYEEHGAAGGERPKRSRYRPEDPAPLQAERPGNGEGVVVIAGSGVLAEELRHAAAEAGYEVRSPHDPTGGVLPALIVECDRRPAASDASSAAPGRRELPRAVLAAGRRTSRALRGGLAGGARPARQRRRLPRAGAARAGKPGRADAQRQLLAGRGGARRALLRGARQARRVGRRRPGLVLGRIVCQVINECAFALGEGVGSERDIDTGMVLGLSYPRGPFEWADAIGLDHVLTVLESLCAEYREERYRPAPVLRRLVQAGRLGRARGAGFFEYDSER